MQNTQTATTFLWNILYPINLLSIWSLFSLIQVQKSTIAAMMCPMSLIKPFKALRPATEYVAEVIAPPYDVISSEEARQYAKGKPWSILHVSKAEIDLPAEIDTYSEQVYQKAKENLASAITKNIYRQDEAASYYIYRQISATHQQTGIVCLVAVEGYDGNRVRKHEHTQPKKEQDRTEQIVATRAQTGPVMLTHHTHEGLQQLVATITATKPNVDVTATDAVQHQLWPVTDAKLLSQITSFVDELGALYIADGHHRTAAAVNTAKILKTPESQYFLGVIFPEDQLQILGYHRVLKDLAGLSVEQFLQHLKHFNITQCDTAVQPKQNRTFGFYAEGQWYQLQYKNSDSTALDADLLNHTIIEPILNIKDIRNDNRIEFVGGQTAIKKIQQLVDTGVMKAGFILCPTQMQDIISVADQHGIMPTKSTWFEPKLADGLFSYLL